MTHPLLLHLQVDTLRCPPLFREFERAHLRLGRVLEIPHDPIGHRSESVSGEEPVGGDVTVTELGRHRLLRLARTAQAVELPECLGVDAVEVQAVHVGDPAVGVKLLEVGRVHPGPGRIGELADRVHVHVSEQRPLLVCRGEGALLRVEHENPRDSAEAADGDHRPVLNSKRPRLGDRGEAQTKPMFLMDHLVAEPVERLKPLPDVGPHRLAISREDNVPGKTAEHLTRLPVRIA